MPLSDQVEPTDTETQAPPPAVDCRDLQLHGPRGTVYGPLDLAVPQGSVTVVQGPQGGGRTSLLLTLAGRMRPDRRVRTFQVLGHELPAERTEVQRAVAVAGFAGIDELDPAVTVAATLRERAAWLSPWYRRAPRVTEEWYHSVAASTFGSRTLPELSTVVWDLDEVDAMLLRITVALLQRPQMLVVDDLDQVHDSARRQLVWDRLQALAAAGLTVVVAVASEDEVENMAWSDPPQQIRLATGPQPVPARTARHREEASR